MTQKLILCGGLVLVLLAAITIHSVVFADAPNKALHTPAVGEARPESSIGRYQIAVFGDPGNGAGPGYYIIDTATGELWMAYRDKIPSRSIGVVTSKASTPEKDQEARRPSPDQQVEQSSRRREIYINATRTQVRDLCNALNMYAVDVGNYPSNEEGLQALIEPPPRKTVRPWQGPYLKYATVPLDPWDRKFGYTYQPKDESPTVTSAGPDGEFDTDDDIKAIPPRRQLPMPQPDGKFGTDDDIKGCRPRK